MERLETVLQAIDAVNATDPKGFERPFSEWLSAWVLRLNPNASEPLRIAARGQHIARWTVPRDSYPMDRGGYLRWREDLKKFHAKTVGDLMRQAGYDDAAIEKTRTIILKKFQIDADAQTIEDALCLVFLEKQFAEFRQKTPEDKMIGILRKSWRKMSDAGRSAALSLPFEPEEKRLMEKALAGSSRE